MFIYMVVGRIETVSYTKCTKSAVIWHKILEVSSKSACSKFKR